MSNLTKAEKQIIRALREGGTISHNGRNYYYRWGSFTRTINWTMWTRITQEKCLIAKNGTDDTYTLTENGKSIIL